MVTTARDKQVPAVDLSVYTQQMTRNEKLQVLHVFAGHETTEAGLYLNGSLLLLLLTAYIHVHTHVNLIKRYSIDHLKMICNDFFYQID